MKLYQNGVSAYMGGSGDHERAPRGEVRGWSRAAARRQTLWLLAIKSEDLTGHGYAVTVTMLHTPETALEMHKVRRAYLARLDRMGATRVHWVVEWQARGTPHFHLAVYFDRELTPIETTMLLVHWLQAASRYEPGVQSQTWEHIRGPVGWLKYLAKHAARGVSHYQRQGHPEGWVKTGRLWGSIGDWPVIEPIVLSELNNREFYRVRRLIRAWAFADARKLGDRDRMKYLKLSKARGGSEKSRYLGASEWIPEAPMIRLVELLMTEAG